MVKKTISSVITVIVLFSLIACNFQYELKSNDIDIAAQTEENTMEDKIRYALFMNFESKPVDRIEPDDIRSDLDVAFFRYIRWAENSIYNDFILVHTAEEAEVVDEDILVAWPGEFTDVTLNQTGGINNVLSLFFREGHRFNELEITFPKPLTYPITMEDLVENWELVWEFIWELKTLDNCIYGGLITSSGNGRRARRRAITEAQANYNDYTVAEEKCESDGCP